MMDTSSKNQQAQTIESGNTGLMETGSSSLDVSANQEFSKTSLLDGLFASSLRGGKKLEAQKVVLDTALEKLRYQADSEVQLSKAFWDAKAAHACEQIKSNAQASLSQIESERAEQRADARLLAVEKIHTKIDQVREASIPDSAKQMLINHLGEELEQIISNINCSSIAKNYGLI